MTFQALPKNTVLIHSGPCPHLHVVLTEPDGEPPTVLVVNVSSKRKNSDQTTVLTSGEHSFLTKAESVVRYDQAKFLNHQPLIKAVEDGVLSVYEDVTDELFEKIRQGILSSPETPLAVKGYCERVLGDIEAA